MPLFWVDSLLMVFYILLSLLIFYYFKSSEMFMAKIFNESEYYIKYNFMW